MDAYGKHLFVRFDGGLTLHSHLRMTGAWAVHRRGERWRRARRRAWLVVRCESWEVVEFDGPVLELMPDARTRIDPRLASLGQDILADSFDWQAFLRRLRVGDDARAIGDVLLDQRTVAGVGNLWKSEACFAAEVDPWRALTDVSEQEVEAVVTFARERMRRSVQKGDSTRPRSVYNRAGQPCVRCGTIVRSGGQGENNRTTYWCPGCQR